MLTMSTASVRGQRPRTPEILTYNITMNMQSTARVPFDYIHTNCGSDNGNLIGRCSVNNDTLLATNQHTANQPRLQYLQRTYAIYIYIYIYVYNTLTLALALTHEMRTAYGFSVKGEIPTRISQEERTIHKGAYTLAPTSNDTAIVLGGTCRRDAHLLPPNVCTTVWASANDTPLIKQVHANLPSRLEPQKETCIYIYIYLHIWTHTYTAHKYATY